MIQIALHKLHKNGLNVYFPDSQAYMRMSVQSCGIFFYL